MSFSMFVPFQSLHEDSNPDNARNDSFSNQNDLVENHSNLSMPQKKVISCSYYRYCAGVGFSIFFLGG